MKKTVCYSPGGNPLTKFECEFRANYRHYPLIVASVGMLGEGTEGSRKAPLWAVMLNMKHDEKLDVSLEELNKTFLPTFRMICSYKKILTILLKPLTKR